MWTETTKRSVLVYLLWTIVGRGRHTVADSLDDLMEEQQHWGIVSVFISRSSIDRCLGSNLLAVLWDEEEEAEDDVENCCFTRVPLVFLYSRDMQHSLSPESLFVPPNQ